MAPETFGANGKLDIPNSFIENKVHPDILFLGINYRSFLNQHILYITCLSHKMACSCRQFGRDLWSAILNPFYIFCSLSCIISKD